MIESDFAGFQLILSHSKSGFPMRKYMIALMLLLFTAIPFAAQTVISGNAPAYAGTRLVFMQNGDWITGAEQPAGSCDVSEQGNFRLEINLESTRQLYVHLGIYLGYFYAEPGKTYELVLPEKTEKSAEDQLNPYFTPVEIQLGLSNFTAEDLNMLVVMFEDAYDPYYQKHVKALYLKSDNTELENDIQQIEKPFQQYSNAFFREFRRYRYGMLKLFANQQRVQSISDDYFNNHPVLYGNPAYADLFNQVYDKYFIFFGRSDMGKQIYEDINKEGSYSALCKSLSKNTNFGNDTLKELVILKQLHDEYYGSQFSRGGLIKILDSLVAKTTIETHKKIGMSIREKITRLQTGYDPPPFKLQDINGNTLQLSDLIGRYVYLNFCTCQSYACLNEFNALSGIFQRHKERLTILTIATDPMDEVLRQFLTRNKYDWTFLLYDMQPEVLKEYDIRAFPTYFLIGPDGKLILSPAPSPAEDFEQRLFEIMKARGDL